jgi:hypothetical protein
VVFVDDRVDLGRQAVLGLGRRSVVQVGDRQAHAVVLRDAHVGPALVVDGRVGDALHEGHRLLEVAQADLAHEGVAVTAPVLGGHDGGSTSP